MLALKYNSSFCSHPAMIGWLQNYLIPCPLKYFTGWDCPLCGFQRSVLALLQGQWLQSFELYPATIPILIIALYLALRNYLPFAVTKSHQKYFFNGTVAIIFIAYTVKLLQHI